MLSLELYEDGIVLLYPKKINVSHVFSEIVLEECMNNLVPIPGSTAKKAVCH